MSTPAKPENTVIKVARRYRISVELMVSRKQGRRIQQARTEVAIRLSERGVELVEIGRLLGGRSPSAIEKMLKSKTGGMSHLLKPTKSRK